MYTYVLMVNLNRRSCPSQYFFLNPTVVKRLLDNCQAAKKKYAQTKGMQEMLIINIACLCLYIQSHIYIGCIFISINIENISFVVKRYYWKINILTASKYDLIIYLPKKHRIAYYFEKVCISHSKIIFRKTKLIQKIYWRQVLSNFSRILLRVFLRYSQGLPREYADNILRIY